MKKHLSKKRVVLAAIIAVALALASGVAYAYWTSTGNGTSTAATAASASPLDVSVTLAGGIHPGGSAAISGSVTNNTTSALQVSQVVGAAVPVTVDAGHSGCVVADFHVGTLTLAGGSPQSLAASGGSANYSGSLSMDNTAADQNACQGAALTLHLVAS